MKKKILSFMLAICLSVPCVFALSACNQSDEATVKVMNVSLNPKIEFVLDENDKVLSVNALNEDGNHIISLSLNEEQTTSAFEGVSADQAIELFLEITEENGYLNTGKKEEIKVEISGKADNLMKKVKDKANKFFTDNGLDIDIVTDKIEKEDILKEVKKCMKEYSETELEDMTQEQLIDLLKGSREETKNLLTQELKDVYYNVRREKINVAEFEELLTIIQNLLETEDDLLVAFQSNMEILKNAINAYEEAYYTYFLSEDSDYYIAKDAYISAKKALLEARKQYGEDEFSEAEQTELALLETAVENAKTTLENAKEVAEGKIETLKTAVDTIFNTVKGSVELIKSTLASLGVNIESLNNANKQAKEKFKNHFESHERFSDYIGHEKGDWGRAE